MRIIFLDIDGVLNSWASYYNITTEKLQLLNDLIEQTGAKVVISSSWRVGSKDVKDFFDNNFSSNCNFIFDNPRQALIYNIFYKNAIGLTDTFGPSRGDEIKRWLDNHEDIESYVIIDDSIDMLDEQLEHLVQTDTYYGITDREVHLAGLILKNKCIPNKVRLNNELYFRYRKKLED
jgi:3-deoxy-D-manno-octulosonate 8-phosphate phosphatase KdsC-like HAD superfamily phosphatase